MGLLGPCSRDGPWRGSATLICESPISTPQRPLSSRSLSAFISISLTPGAKSHIRFLLTCVIPSGSSGIPSFRTFQQVVSFESLRWKSLSWACAADKCMVDGKPSREAIRGTQVLLKGTFRSWERLLETFDNGLSWPHTVPFFLLGDHSPSPPSPTIREECEDTDRKEITPFIHTGQDSLRGRQKSSDLGENCEGWVEARGWGRLYLWALAQALQVACLSWGSPPLIPVATTTPVLSQPPGNTNPFPISFEHN